MQAFAQTQIDYLMGKNPSNGECTPHTLGGRCISYQARSADG